MKKLRTTVLSLLAVLLLLTGCASAAGSDSSSKDLPSTSSASISSVFNSRSKTSGSVDSTSSDEAEYTYILNTRTMKIHLPDCESVDQMADKNKQYSDESEEDLIEEGYEPCKKCNPFGADYDTGSTSSGNSQTVYVSNSGKIHSNPNCSGMKYYSEMTYDEAISKGYVLCKKCY